MKTTEEIADYLYTVYCDAVGGIAFNGDPLPSWEEFGIDPNKTKQANAWRKTAEAAQTVVNVPSPTENL